MGNFKGGPGFEQIQLMIDVRPATQDKESSVEISGALIGRCRKGGGGRERGKGILAYPFAFLLTSPPPPPPPFLRLSRRLLSNPTRFYPLNTVKDLNPGVIL